MFFTTKARGTGLGLRPPSGWSKRTGDEHLQVSSGWRHDRDRGFAPSCGGVLTMNVMLPREHGAYGQLLLPVLTAMAMGRPTLAAVALAASAAAAFVAHEPLMVLIGRRGARARGVQHRQALICLLACGAAAIGLVRCRRPVAGGASLDCPGPARPGRCRSAGK